MAQTVATLRPFPAFVRGMVTRAVEDARAQTLTRAERAERQLDEVAAELRALRAAAPK